MNSKEIAEYVRQQRAIKVAAPQIEYVERVYESIEGNEKEADAIEEEIANVKEHGVTFIDESITTLPSGSRYIFFTGPDGEWIELFQKK